MDDEACYVGKGFSGVVYSLDKETVAKVCGISNRKHREFQDGLVELTVSDENKIFIAGVEFALASHWEAHRLRDVTNEYRFLRELEDLPGVVRPHGLYFGFTQGYLQGVIEMERAPGFPVAEQSLTVPDIAKVLADTGNVLLGLAERTIVHRDLKKDNIMYREGGSPGQGTTTVLDFQFAEYIPELQGYEPELLRELQHRGAFAYFAPEHARGEIRIESDWFAYGLLAYELLMGESAPVGVCKPLVDVPLPARFHARLQQLLTYSNFEKDAIAGMLHMRGYSADLARAVGCCLDENPANRDILPLMYEAEQLAELRAGFKEYEATRTLVEEGRF